MVITSGQTAETMNQLTLAALGSAKSHRECMVSMLAASSDRRRLVKPFLPQERTTSRQLLDSLFEKNIASTSQRAHVALLVNAVQQERGPRREETASEQHEPTTSHSGETTPSK